ncbi:MAG: CDF family Co(II)/Ni(II) efflux transporter DmeF [Alphaproteobacteria bacterium]|nr:CDF family Co(II)/Ni(II) efflux transporter DmeF [Alphaproteobacteria bacterium]
MHVHTLHKWQHDHHFLDEAAIASGQRRVLCVVALTAVTMVVEIIAGWIFNSMALIADGWHMASHTAALSITLYAYWYARGHARDPRYTFGTGKVGVLGGFSSALILGVVALLLAWESVDRLASPLAIAFDQAIVVAVVGLVVNLASAWILRGGGHGHSHVHDHGHAHEEDHNLRSAYFHVLADALTSVLAIVALLSGKYMGWAWMDPMMGIVGALVIARWSYGLLRDTSPILLDGGVDEETVGRIKETIESDADNLVADIHIWRVGSGRMAVILSVVTHQPRPPEHYKALLKDHSELAHITVEVNGCAGKSCLPRKQTT